MSCFFRAGASVSSSARILSALATYSVRASKTTVCRKVASQSRRTRDGTEYLEVADDFAA